MALMILLELLFVTYNFQLLSVAMRPASKKKGNGLLMQPVRQC